MKYGEEMLKRLQSADHLPSLPVVVAPLLNYLQQPIDSLQVNEVARFISQDDLAARCLHLANSPLFGRWQSVETVRGAVVSLGLRRMREIATSCCLINLTPKSAPWTRRCSGNTLSEWLSPAATLREKSAIRTRTKPTWPACCTISEW